MFDYLFSDYFSFQISVKKYFSFDIWKASKYRVFGKSKCYFFLKLLRFAQVEKLGAYHIILSSSVCGNWVLLINFHYNYRLIITKVWAHYQKNNSIVTAQRLFCFHYEIWTPPHRNIIREWIKMIESTGSTVTIQNTVGIIGIIRNDRPLLHLRLCINI